MTNIFTGLPAADCSLSPPDKKLVQIANITAADAHSGIGPSGISINVTANEPMDPSDFVIIGGVVQVRATRQGNGNGRIYTVTAQVSDRAGNRVVGSGTCTVPKGGGGNGNGNGNGKDKGNPNDLGNGREKGSGNDGSSVNDKGNGGDKGNGNDKGKPPK